MRAFGRFVVVGLLCALVMIAALAASQVAYAQQEAEKQNAEQPEKANPEEANAEGGFRQLAPGVLKTVTPETQPHETHSWHHIAGLLKQAPNFGERPGSPRNLAKDVRMEHDVWGLDFSFKPIRFIEVDIPDGSGKVERKTVWYLMYRVTNRSDKPVRYVPRFLLHAQQSGVGAKEEDPGEYYPDRLIPVATPAIQRREDPRRKLLNCVEISQAEIAPSTEEEDNSVWGVATWRDVDPQTDRFSVYVQGLSNAYKIETDEEGNWQQFLRKTLQLNFWRPSDEFYASEREIRYGWPGDVDYRWVYK